MNVDVKVCGVGRSGGNDIFSDLLAVEGDGGDLDVGGLNAGGLDAGGLKRGVPQELDVTR